MNSKSRVLLQRLADMIRAGEIPSKKTFFAHYCFSYGLFHEHWSEPAAVFLASKFLARKYTKVLDVGSGIGSAMWIAALLHPETDFVGVERRPIFIDIAIERAKAMKLKNLSFIENDVFAIDWTAFDGIYFFSPFGENVIPKNQRIPDGTPYSLSRFQKYTNEAQRKLDAYKPGNLVATHWGMGAPLPSTYRLVESHPNHKLEFYKKIA